MIKKCILCKREFDTYDKLRKGRNLGRKYKRSRRCITCSKKCSADWFHLSKRTKAMIRKEMRNEI